MNIFIRNLPRGVTRRELRTLVESAMVWRFLLPFRVQGRMRGSRIVVIHDQDTGDLARHAIVSIEPEKAALHVIKRLNHSRINGRLVEVHAYHSRSRRLSAQRSGCERRRAHLELEDDRGPISQAKKRRQHNF